MIKFIESGMEFAIDEGSSFHIEKSECYKEVKSHGVKTVEFVTMIKNRIFVVEAKQSAPKNEEGLFWEQCKDKDVHSMLVMSKAILTDNTTEIGSKLVDAIKQDMHIVFLLILKGFDTVSCGDFGEVYRGKIKEIAKIYNAEALVINDTQARKLRLIQ